MSNDDHRSKNHHRDVNTITHIARTTSNTDDNRYRRQGRSIGLRRLYLAIFFTAVGFYKTRSTLSDNGPKTQIPIIQYDHHDEAPSNDKQGHIVNINSIRRWGCSRNETPFIFVHIGKAGGGSVRRMFAAAAVDYTRPRDGDQWYDMEGAYHLIHIDVPSKGSSDDTSTSTATNTIAKARFANSDHKNFRPRLGYQQKGSFEGNRQCDAETPIGQALVCPNTSKSRCPNEDSGDPAFSSASCHLVYVGHNMIGSEMHWLPSGYLQRWWDSTVGGNSDGGTITAKITSWEDMPNWSKCGQYDQKQEFPLTSKVKQCRKKLEREVDSLAYRTFYNSSIIQSWSPLYASLPVLRVTMTREPFSWLASKYTWHKMDRKGRNYENIEEMTRRSNTTEAFANFLQSKSRPPPGWANYFALRYIMDLCGEDCLVRYVHGSATLQDVTKQAEENLRHSFAVVGLLNETQSFYSMVSARVAYMGNLTRNMNLASVGGKHSTKGRRGVKKVFADPHFQRRLIDASPEFAALLKLYEVSVEVNRFQLKELSSCPSWDPLEGRS